MGNRAARCRKALSEHTATHRDIDSVDLWALDVEVQRLCEAADSKPSQGIDFATMTVLGPAVTSPSTALTSTASLKRPAPIASTAGACQRPKRGKKRRKQLAAQLGAGLEECQTQSASTHQTELGP